MGKVQELTDELLAVIKKYNLPNLISIGVLQVISTGLTNEILNASQESTGEEKAGDNRGE